MEYPFADAIWNALHTRQRSLALDNGLACKYPHDVAPFAAVAEDSPEAFVALHALMQPGESTWLFRNLPLAKGSSLPPGLTHDISLPCLQMLFPETAPLPETTSTAQLLPLDATHAPEMVALTDIAFPGFFRANTHLMGNYFGIRDEAGQLIAICGERIITSGMDGTVWREISGLCTHPDHRGHGYGTQLLRKLIEDHRAQQAVSVLHVSATNSGPIELYHRLGFLNLREFPLRQLVRTD
jgi:GNAT superfamily N-acetyltransferase